MNKEFTGKLFHYDWHEGSCYIFLHDGVEYKYEQDGDGPEHLTDKMFEGLVGKRVKITVEVIE